MWAVRLLALVGGVFTICYFLEKLFSRVRVYIKRKIIIHKVKKKAKVLADFHDRMK